ncbi:MAG: hypothetical protein MUC99_11440 [Anaerolineae bacterium]|jgi:hypothetical protein|nr:hypothetical protein [Anaerolineae bacterium]
MSQQPPPPYERIPPDHVGMFIAAALMGVTAWVGLYWLIFQNPPHIGGQLWLFFVLLSIAVSCTVLPFVRYFNVRLTPLDRDLPPSGVIIRQSVWVGLYVAVCAWLQIPRALSVAAATLLAIAFIGVEVFLRARENSSVQR